MKIFFILFLFLDYLLNTIININTEYSFYIISLIYNIPLLYGSFIILDDNRFWKNKIYFHTPLSNILVMWSIAYFMFEIIYYLKYYWPYQHIKYTLFMIIRYTLFMIYAFLSLFLYMYMYKNQKYHFFITTIFLTCKIYPFNNISYVNNRYEQTLLYKISCVFSIILYCAWISYIIKDGTDALIGNILKIL